MVKPSELIAIAIVGIVGAFVYLLYKGESDLANFLQGFQLPNLSLPSLPNITLPNITLPNITLPGLPGAGPANPYQGSSGGAIDANGKTAVSYHGSGSYQSGTGATIRLATDSTETVGGIRGVLVRPGV